MSQQKLFQELPSPQAKKLLENVTTCDDGKENSCTTFLRQRIKFSTKHTSSLEFPGILQCDCTSNKRFASSCSLQIKNSCSDQSHRSWISFASSRLSSERRASSHYIRFCTNTPRASLLYWDLASATRRRELARMGPRFRS